MLMPTVDSTPAAWPLLSSSALPESPGMPGVTIVVPWLQPLPSSPLLMPVFGLSWVMPNRSSELAVHWAPFVNSWTPGWIVAAAAGAHVGAAPADGDGARATNGASMTAASTVVRRHLMARERRTGAFLTRQTWAVDLDGIWLD